MTSLSVHIAATTTRVHVKSKPPRHHSTAPQMLALCSRGTLAMRTLQWVLVNIHSTPQLCGGGCGWPNDHRTHDTTLITTRQRRLRRKLRSPVQVSSTSAGLDRQRESVHTILVHDGWSTVAEPVVEDQGKTTGGSPNHQQASTSHTCAPHEFVGKCAITTILTSPTGPRPRKHFSASQHTDRAAGSREFARLCRCASTLHQSGETFQVSNKDTTPRSR